MSVEPCSDMGYSAVLSAKVCKKCGKSFTKNSHLTEHMHTHSGERPYPCEECGKSFAQSSHLTIHMRKHSGERPYPCEECGQSFARSSSLTKHMRMHSGERPYPCEECGKSFAVSGHLTAHMRTHSGERPYPCEECGKSFTVSGNLTAHMRTHRVALSCVPSTVVGRRSKITIAAPHTDRPTYAAIAASGADSDLGVPVPMSLQAVRPTASDSLSAPASRAATGSRKRSRRDIGT